MHSRADATSAAASSIGTPICHAVRSVGPTATTLAAHHGQRWCCRGRRHWLYHAELVVNPSGGASSAACCVGSSISA
eukprot:scaffold5248_cov17-Prasinocladus_malaysianus.AAC.1